MLKPLYVCISIIGIFGLVKVCNANCEEVQFLYAQRIEIINSYLKDDIEADVYEKQLKDLDAKYKSIIYDLFIEYERGQYSELERCKNYYRKDPYLFYVVKQLEYFNNNDANEFLKDLPIDNIGLSYLWEIDRITATTLDNDNEGRPLILDISSFANLFMDSLYILASKGNRIAMNVFLGIGKSVDGEYGEYWDEQIYRLIKDHPITVINNWDLIKKYKESISLLTTGFAYQAEEIIRDYNTICVSRNVEPSTCRDINTFLRLKYNETISPVGWAPPTIKRGA